MWLRALCVCLWAAVQMACCNVCNGGWRRACVGGGAAGEAWRGAPVVDVAIKAVAAGVTGGTGRR